MPVADLGTQAVLIDPTGAHLGAWQPGTFPGFTVLGEHGTPSWFELFTRDHAAAVAFYRSVFRWETNTIGDTDEFRYTTMRDPSGDGGAGRHHGRRRVPPRRRPGPLVGLLEGRRRRRLAVAKVRSLGGSVVRRAEDTPYGRLATVTDPSGAQFKLRTGPT